MIYYRPVQAWLKFVTLVHSNLRIGCWSNEIVNWWTKEL